MNALQRYEYVTLRLIRRFVFTERLANRLAGWLPYYAPSVGENDPARIVADYVRALAAANVVLAGQRTLEVGAGRSNGVGYGLIAAGATSACLLEPFVAFDAARDAALRESSPAFAAVDPRKLRRVRDFSQIADASIDLILSNSVL